VKDAAVVVLLAVGVASQLLACIGVAAMRSVYDRLHYTAPTALGAVAIAAALLVEEGFSLIADRGLMLAALVIVTSPVIVQAMARAARISQYGSLDATGSDIETVR
jgi:monovalent cation/proton antiporter MnhG/PhaG subunit